MGRAGARFGRNVPFERTFPKPEPGLQEPSPRLVSRELLTRDPFVPATSVNALVAPWLQFMIRDWFSHGRGDAQPHVDDPARGRRPVAREADGDPADAGRPDAAAGRRRLPAHLPQHRVALVGRLAALRQLARAQKLLRSGVDGKLHIRDDGLLPTPPDPQHDPSQVPGFWLGIGADADDLHPRAQRDLRPAARRVPVVDGRRHLRARPARQRGADREDPHRRVDAGGDQPPDDGDRRCAPTGGASPARSCTTCSAASRRAR